MMKIGIDGRVLTGKMTGIGRTLETLLLSIPAIDNRNEYFLFTNNSSNPDEKFYKIIPIKNSILPSKFHSPYWLNFELPGLIRKYNLDLFFTSNLLLPLKNIGNTKKIAMVHDVIYKIHSEFYPLSYRMYLNFLLPLTLKKADMIITVSEQSRKDIWEWFKLNHAKTGVIYNSAESKFMFRILEQETERGLRKKYNLNEKFLLYVGMIEKRKNIIGLIQLTKILAQRGNPVKLVLVGRPGYGFKEILPAIENNKDLVSYLNYVDDSDLPFLYNLAKVFLFLSLYEGFGLPPLEAMQSGLPVICANNSALPEIIGDGGILCDVDNQEKIIMEIENLLKDDSYYDMWRKKGINRAQFFTSRQSAINLVNIFNEIAD